MSNLLIVECWKALLREATPGQTPGEPRPDSSCLDRFGKLEDFPIQHSAVSRLFIQRILQNFACQATSPSVLVLINLNSVSCEVLPLFYFPCLVSWSSHAAQLCCCWELRCWWLPFQSPALLWGAASVMESLSSRCFRVFSALLRHLSITRRRSCAQARCEQGLLSRGTAQIPAFIFTAMDSLLSLAASEAGWLILITPVSL